jgi:hypothetical protein
VTYTYWQRALALVGDCGKLSRAQVAEIGPVSEDDPQPGFYMWPSWRGSEPKPVAFWHEDGQIRCAVGGEIYAYPSEAWVWALKTPITEETYRAVAERGEPWPSKEQVA